VKQFIELIQDYGIREVIKAILKLYYVDIIILMFAQALAIVSAITIWEAITGREVFDAVWDKAAKIVSTFRKPKT
jgi:hypothetical protein